MTTQSPILGIPFLGPLLVRLNLRFPALFALLAALTLVNILVPDPIPLVDELAMALITLLVSQIKARQSQPPR
jgi:hypothetical protein